MGPRDGRTGRRSYHPAVAESSGLTRRRRDVTECGKSCLAGAPYIGIRAPMRSLSTYVLRQIIGPLALFTLLMTMVVWLTQSLRLLDLVINRGQSAVTFAYLTFLLLPTLLTIIIPIAFFAGSLFALHKLNTDSELVVMWSAGFSRLQLAMPVLIAAAGAMLITYMCSLWLMPLGQRTMKDKVFDIRSDIGASSPPPARGSPFSFANSVPAAKSAASLSTTTATRHSRPPISPSKESSRRPKVAHA
jgi:hypothetical protein